MRKTISLLLALSVLTTPAVAVAETKQKADPPALFNLKVVNISAPPVILVVNNPLKIKPKPIIYTVKEGDNLTTIGTKHNVKWQRLFFKNKQIKNPDIIYAGQKITIPLPDEKLTKRTIPANTALPAITPGVSASSSYTASSNGNTYDYGYCTWYVKNRRGSSLPNGLGNANTWYETARSLGMAVGSTPKAGAVGTTTRGDYGHVVYVESVNKDGTIEISEMNYEGFAIVSHRTASAGEFLYIY